MPQRPIYRIAALAVSAAVLLSSASFGFDAAWQSQFTLPAYAAQDPLAAASRDSGDSAGALEADAAADPAGASADSAASNAPDASNASEGQHNAAAAPQFPPSPIPAPQPSVALSNRIVDYDISVKLVDGGRLEGSETLTWKNPGRKPVTDLYLHLYPNAFAPGSTFLNESNGQLRGVKMTPGKDGAMELSELTTEDGETLLPRLRYVQPDDGNAQDRTLASFRLPKAVAPGQTVTVRMKFTVKLPQVFARMGQAGDFVMAGQWFPKVAAYETTGVRGRTAEGWDLHQYHGNSEFYADFGVYGVKIDVPEDRTVAATGFQYKQPVVKDGRKTYQFYAEDVHDFSWSASPDFVTAEDSFSSAGVPGVRIKLYLDPLHAKQEERYMHAAKSALAKLGEWYGDYPYTTLSIVVPPADAEGAGGMEYPTLVTGAAAKDDNPGYELERTLVHEIAHQYWYGIVASNEFEEAWLDEAFTSYTEDKLMAAIYGVSARTPIESLYMTNPMPLKLDAWDYGGSDAYAENVYMRGKLVLKAIEAKTGEKTMSKIMRTYFQKYRFKHPDSQSFQRVVEAVTRDDWKDFFQAYVYRGESADFAVASIRTEPDGEGGYQSIVLLTRTQGSPQAATVQFGFKDGKTVRKTWDGIQSHIQIRLQSASPLSYVAVDPMLDIVLDHSRYDNYLKAEAPVRKRTKLDVTLGQLIDAIVGSMAW
ncbi:M1 family metallopeptidase [Cohnella sp. GCM10020058]|uniref:M1 family metallopeptidase n=1 Tax=Cohnella sp. GCM10020058 TaxID=3317330 RepID=UPI00362A8C8D